jgi:hypothetical protein
MNYRKSGEKNGVPFRTIRNKIKEKHPLKHGGQTALSTEQESSLVTVILAAAEWGYPLTKNDIRLMVKNYLDENKLNCSKFKDNLPGNDWCASFLKRHSELTSRKCQNVKKARATVKLEEFEEYFDNLEKTMDGVLPEDVINYDETNATDDPGEEKVVVRKATKHAERIMDSSKSSTSLMFSGTATGHMLPVYVVYKAINMYESWTEGGPPNAIYNRTKSGWFDMETFEDWYFKVPLKYFKTRPPENKKVLIGDNCASHLSVKVIKSCMEHCLKTQLTFLSRLMLLGSNLSKPFGVKNWPNGRKKIVESCQRVDFRKCWIPP